MGRPRMTQNQLVLSGQNILKPKRYSSYNLVPGKVIPKDVQLTPPKNYDKTTKKAFKIISSNLIAMGALSEQDLPAFSLMMDSLNDYYKYISLLELLDTTMSLEDDDYIAKRDKLVRRRNDAGDRFYKWCSKFGITPADRSRLICEAIEKGDNNDPLSILMGN